MLMQRADGLAASSGGLRIAHLMGSLGTKMGAYERWAVLLAQKCRQRGHEIVFLHDRANLFPEYVDQIANTGSRHYVMGDTYKDILRSIGWLRSFLARWKPDVVHVHFSSHLTWMLAHLMGVPLVYQSLHNPYPPDPALKTRAFLWLMIRWTRRVIAVSEAIKESVTRLDPSGDRLCMIYMGIPIPGFSQKVQSGPEKPLPPGTDALPEKTVITVARQDRQKALSDILEAADIVRQEVPEVCWLIVGREGDETQRLKALHERLGLEGTIYFLGQRNDVAWLVSRSWLHVLSSLYEGLPQAVLEAAIVGVPTVAYAIDGICEAVIDGQTGLLVPPQSPTKLAHAVIRVLEDPVLRQRLGREAQLDVRQRFDANRTIDQLLDMYEVDRQKRQGT